MASPGCAKGNAEAVGSARSLHAMGDAGVRSAELCISEPGAELADCGL